MNDAETEARRLLTAATEDMPPGIDLLAGFTKARLRDRARRTRARIILPGGAAPLDLAALRRRPRWRPAGRFAPLIAAAAVVVVVALSLVLASVLAVPRPPAGPPDLAGVPSYYVTLTSTGPLPAAGVAPFGYPTVLSVRSTVTGTVLATVRAPHPYRTFTLVEGTADDRRFLVAAQQWRNPNPWAPVQLYWLRFDPATSSATLTALPIPPLKDNWWTASVSPDGTRLAVVYDGATSLRLYTLPGGTEQTVALAPWYHYFSWFGDDPASIGWTADSRTISFQLSADSTGSLDGVYLAGVAALVRAGSLQGPSRLALPRSSFASRSGQSGFQCFSDPMLSADGKYILCGGWVRPAGFQPGPFQAYPKGPVTQGFAEYSAATGKLITILGSWRAPMTAAPPYLLWASPDATTVIGTANGRGIVVADGRSQVIPWSAHIAETGGGNIVGAAW